jgi:hypothetical protein
MYCMFLRATLTVLVEDTAVTSCKSSTAYCTVLAFI